MLLVQGDISVFASLDHSTKVKSDPFVTPPPLCWIPYNSNAIMIPRPPEIHVLRVGQDMHT